MLTQSRADAGDVARARKGPAAPSITPEIWILGALLLLAAVLRFSTLTSQSYWYDEAQAAHEFQRSFGALISALNARETNPPLYFVVGWFWAKVFGTSEAALRSLSALAGVAAVALAYACGRELISRRAGLVAAALAAINPFMIWYSQEAREYMLLAALSAASLLWFARAVRTGAPRALTWWALCSALAVLTHFFAAFIVWPEAAWLLYVHRRRATVVACAAVAAVQVALLPFAFTHATKSLLSFIGTTPLSNRIQQVPVAFALGTLDQSRLVDYGLLGAGVLAAVLIALLVGGAEGGELRGAAIAAALAACVLILPLLAAALGHDFFIPRALTPAWIPLAVVIGGACTARHARLPGAALGLILAGLFIYGQVRVQSSPEYQRPDWRGVAHALGHAQGSRTIAVYSGSLATDPLIFYLPRTPWSTPLRQPVELSELDVVAGPLQSLTRPLPAGIRLISDRMVGQFQVVRFALSPAQQLTPEQAAARAPALIGPAGPDTAVLLQPAG